MKATKRILSLVLCTVMLLGVLSMAVSAAWEPFSKVTIDVKNVTTPIHGEKPTVSGVTLDLHGDLRQTGSFEWYINKNSNPDSPKFEKVEDGNNFHVIGDYYLRFVVESDRDGFYVGDSTEFVINAPGSFHTKVEKTAYGSYVYVGYHCMLHFGWGYEEFNVTLNKLQLDTTMTAGDLALTEANTYYTFTTRAAASSLIATISSAVSITR